MITHFPAFAAQPNTFAILLGENGWLVAVPVVGWQVTYNNGFSKDQTYEPIFLHGTSGSDQVPDGKTLVGVVYSNVVTNRDREVKSCSVPKTLQEAVNVFLDAFPKK